MLRVALALPVVLSFVVPVYGQEIRRSPALDARMEAEGMVARVLERDRNQDGAVDREELAERMHGLFERGDSNLDGRLETAELRQLTLAPPVIESRGFVRGSYGFFDDLDGSISLFSPAGRIEAALDDLKLPPEVRARASAAALAYVAGQRSLTLETLAAALGETLSPAQMTRAAAIIGEKKDMAAAPGTPARTWQSLVQSLEAQLRGFIETTSLTIEQRRDASAVLAQFRKDTVLNDARQHELTAALAGILDDEDRENLRASLGRRMVTSVTTVTVTLSDQSQDLQTLIERLREDRQLR